MKDIIPIFIGYDPREAIAYHTCVNSIIRHASQPVSIVPVALNLFQDYKETHGDNSNHFVYTRFLVPYLMSWTGSAIFIDGDMIVRGDIAELWSMRDMSKDVQVVKHDYKTKMPVKYLGSKNENYPRKNWSSVILWNCGSFPNRKLTPEFVQLVSPYLRDVVGRRGIQDFRVVCDDSNNTPPAAAPQVVEGQAPTCKHGTMAFRNGTSARGPWKAWMCAAPKGAADKCEAIFLR